MYLIDFTPTWSILTLQDLQIKIGEKITGIAIFVWLDSLMVSMVSREWNAQHEELT